MKAKKIIKTIIVCVGVLLFCLHPSVLAQEGYREPFSKSGEEVFDTRLPSETSQKIPAGQPLKAPPGQGGNPLGIPVGDTLWILPILCFLYGVFRRKKSNEKVFV